MAATDVLLHGEMYREPIGAISRAAEKFPTDAVAVFAMERIQSGFRTGSEVTVAIPQKRALRRSEALQASADADFRDPKVRA